jgi:hypothetical protein
MQQTAIREIQRLQYQIVGMSARITDQEQVIRQLERANRELRKAGVP